MSATPRDLLKTRPARLGEVLSLNHLKAGQANSQVVLWGLDLSVHTDTDEFAIAKGEYVLAQSIITRAASTDHEVPAGATTGAGEYRKVLIEVNASGTVSTVVGAVSTVDQAHAALPLGGTDKISIGYLELPPSFTAGTTALTSPMLKMVSYFAS